MSYPEVDLPPEFLAEIERHLLECPACAAYVQTRLDGPAPAGRDTRLPMPADLKARFHAFLLTQLEAH